MFLLAVIGTIFILSSPGWAQEIGSPAPDFTATDTHGASHSLSSYKGKFVVLEWTNYECPFIKKHYESFNMQNLQRAYTEKGVIWFSVNSSALGKQGNFTPDEWNQKIHEKGSKATAVLLDSDGKVGQLYGAKTTPHMFVINPDGILIYKGAVDDIPSTDKADISKAHNYVQAALDEAMTGKEVTQPENQSYGCPVKY